MLRHLTVSLVLLAVLCSCHRDYDRSFDTAVARPAFATRHPRLGFDQGHREHHSPSNSYRPFAELMRHDGFEVEPIEGATTADALRKIDVLAIVTAEGANATNDAPAFTEAECDAIERWVAGGGSLLLVVDHYPFGSAAAPLARRFGVEIHGGMTLDEVNSDHASGDDSQLVFSRDNHLLADQPLTRGVNRVVTFTGTALRGGTPILLLGETAVNRPATATVRGDDVNVTYGNPQPARGWSQAVILEHGRGRVAVLAEAAMLSAQLDRKRPVGMNLPNTDNRQFALNLLRWLGRAAG